MLDKGPGIIVDDNGAAPEPRIKIAPEYNAVLESADGLRRPLMMYVGTRNEFPPEYRLVIRSAPRFDINEPLGTIQTRSYERAHYKENGMEVYREKV